MTRLLFIGAFLFIASSLFSQDSEVIWYFSYNEKSSEIEMKAEITKGWHLYSQAIAEDAGPVATEFEFTANKNLTLIGSVIEPKSIESYDPNFEATLNYFEDQVVFKQKVKSKSNTNLTGSVIYMVCNETMCLPPVVKEFNIEIHP